MLRLLMPAFKVLSEVSQPKRRFAKATIGTMILIAVLFILANAAYVSQVEQNKFTLLTSVQLCAVPREQITDTELDMANIFFRQVFGGEIAPRVMSGIIAFSIAGNIVVMTFTASRGKNTLRPRFSARPLDTAAD